MGDISRLGERTSQQVIKCIDVFRKSVHYTANRLEAVFSGRRNTVSQIVRTVVSKKDIGLYITWLMAS